MPILHAGAPPRRRPFRILSTPLARAALAALVGAGLLATATPVMVPSAQATPVSTPASTHRSARAHDSAQAPRCGGPDVLPNRPAAWIDNHNEHSPLVRNIATLICSAANHATIDIKSWFIQDDDPTVDDLVTDLRLMHQVHHVRVNVLVGRDVYRTDQRSWRAFTRAFSFAHISSCYRECGDDAPGTVPHGKWMTVSALRQGGPAVLSLSTNWSHEQFASAQSGIFIPDDPQIYDAFAARWKSFQPCFNGAPCTVSSNAHWYTGTQHTAVYFAPIPADLTAAALAGVDCTEGGTISVLSLFFHRHPIERQLLNLQAQGCQIRIVLEHAPSARLAAEFPTRCEHQHDKAMVIDVPGQREVIAGSESLTTHALTINENQTVRSSAPGVVNTYRRYLGAQWRSATTCGQG
jgi:hypothetical protein